MSVGPIELAAVLAAAVLLASMLSVEFGIAVALFELGLGVVLGNAFDLNAGEPWRAQAIATRRSGGSALHAEAQTSRL